MFTALKNANATILNFKKLVLYPEHKLKHQTMIISEELSENVTLVNQLQEFTGKVKQWEKDQIFRNKNIKQNISRDQKNDQEMKKWINKKAVLSTFLIQENSVFFAEKFNNDKAKIVNFYKKSLDAYLEMTGIPREQLVSAIIHFDQSTPHMHVSISNLSLKYYKTLDKNLYTVNQKKFNPSEILRQKYVEKLKTKYKIIEPKIKMLKDAVKKEHDVRQNIRHTTSFYEPITREISRKYENKIYKTPEDQIKIANIRGYEREIFPDKLNNKEWKNMYNGVIYKYRKATIEKNMTLTKADRRDNGLFRLRELEKEYQLTKTTEHTFKMSKQEHNILNKRKYFMRVELDMASLGIPIEKYDNKIKMNRDYNKVLLLCHAKQTELKDRQLAYTPQTLAKELYEGTYKAIDNNNHLAKEIEQEILQSRELEPRQELGTSRDLFEEMQRRQKAENNIVIERTRQFHGWTDMSVVNEVEFNFDKLGIDEQNIMKISVEKQIEGIMMDQLHGATPKTSNNISHQLEKDSTFNIKPSLISEISPQILNELNVQNTFIPKDKISINTDLQNKVSKINEINEQAVGSVAGEGGNILDDVINSAAFNKKLEIAELVSIHKINPKLAEGMAINRNIDKRIIRSISNKQRKATSLERRLN